MVSVAVLGAGSSGSMTVARLSRYTDAEIDWYFDPDKPPVSVGEASDLSLPVFLDDAVDYQHTDLDALNGTHKSGIEKIGWGGPGATDFTHTFPANQVAMHFTAHQLQEYLYEKVKGREGVNVILRHATEDELDHDYVVRCTGFPSNLDGDEFETDTFIPVNASYVVRIPWDQPEYSHSFHFARKYGWVFGIPTQSHLSLGYQFNTEFNCVEEVADDLRPVLAHFDADYDETSGTLFEYTPYYRPSVFENRNVYVGNAASFLEPLEATSLSNTIRVINDIHGILIGAVTSAAANAKFEEQTRRNEAIIMLHYLAGSRWNTPFWRFAQTRAKEAIENISEEHEWREVVRGERLRGEFGVWPQRSFDMNLDGLGIRAEVKSIAETSGYQAVTKYV